MPACPLLATTLIALAALVRGNVLLSDNETLLLRTERGETRAVDMSAVPPEQWHAFQPGDPVVVEGSAGDSGDAFVAAGARPDPGGQRAAYRTARGMVRAMTETTATVRTAEGQVLSLDVSAIPPAARPGPNDTVMVTYEDRTGGAAALWMARDGSIMPEAGAAPSPDPPPQDGAPATSEAEYQRLRGRVETVSPFSIGVRLEDGRVVICDTSGVSPQAMAAMQTGDIVTVVGQVAGGVFRADSVQKE